MAPRIAGAGEKEMRKDHLKSTTGGRAVCAGRRTGYGREYIVLPFAEFKASTVQCGKCKSSKLFSHLTAKDAPARDWEPEHPDAWKEADDKLLAAHRAKKAGE